MEKEKILNIYELSENKKRLLDLEKSNNFVFHGSTSNIGVLTPRQGYNFNKKTNKMEKDGDPAIFATKFVEIAIFRALINKNNVQETNLSYFNIENNSPCFAATQNLIDAAKTKTGKVYVLNKNQFQEHNKMESISHTSSVPIESIDVVFQDLPKNIKIIK